MPTIDFNDSSSDTTGFSYKVVTSFSTSNSTPSSPKTVDARRDLVFGVLVDPAIGMSTLGPLHPEMSPLVSLAILGTESTYNPRGFHPYAYARGIGQFIVESADDPGKVIDVWNYADNVMGTTRYMNKLFNQHNYLGNRDKIMLYSAMGYLRGFKTNIKDYAQVNDQGTGLSPYNYARKFAKEYNRLIDVYYTPVGPNPRPASVKPIDVSVLPS